MNPINIKLLFAFASILISGGMIVALLMMLSNSVQKRVTKRDRAGYGITIIGLLLAGISGCFATGIFSPAYGTFDLSGMFTLIFANMAGVPLGLGITISLPDEITDPFLDTKNIWKLAVTLAVLLAGAVWLFG